MIRGRLGSCELTSLLDCVAALRNMYVYVYRVEVTQLQSGVARVELCEKSVSSDCVKSMSGCCNRDRYFPHRSFPHRYFPGGFFLARSFPRRSFPRQVFSRIGLFPRRSFPRQVFSTPVFPPPFFIKQRRQHNGNKLSKKFFLGGDSGRVMVR